MFIQSLKKYMSALIFQSVLMPLLLAQNQDDRFQFTGTVIGSDTELPFESPLDISSSLKAKVGDRISLTISLGAANPEYVLSPREDTAIYRTGIEIELELNGQMITGNDPFGGTGVSALVIDNGHQVPTDLPDGGIVILPDGNPLVSGDADAFILAINQGGYFENGKLIHTGVLVNGEVDERLSLTLNFTDASGTVFESTRFPQSLDLKAFSLAKGFLSLGPGGILFELDPVKETESNQDPISLSTGFHVSWPSSAKGYVLEASDFSTGPWGVHEGRPLVVDGQNIVVMDIKEQSKFYRLSRPE